MTKPRSVVRDRDERMLILDEAKNLFAKREAEPEEYKFMSFKKLRH